MASPFPGMNPYLEQRTAWHDFHESFMPLAREIIAAQVRPHFIVKIDEHIFIHELSAEERFFLGRADVALTQSPKNEPHSGGTAVLDSPARGQLPGVDIERLSLVEIRDRKSGQVVTVIELLSPSNKDTGPDREQYLGKRSLILHSNVHFVEIDLLRGGPRMPLIDLPECDYFVLVSRAEERPSVGLWPIRLRDRLPVIPIPLPAPHANVKLDLQVILNRLYDAAGYEDYIYGSQPEPSLGGEDADWARQFVPSN